MIDLEINILFVSDQEIKKYNCRYFGSDRPTDVIAFPMEEKGILGDIVISLDRAKRQAKEQGHSLMTEVKILMIHGLLHLTGYRDKRKKEREAMWKKTNELLALVEAV